MRSSPKGPSGTGGPAGNAQIIYLLCKNLQGRVSPWESMAAELHIVREQEVVCGRQKSYPDGSSKPPGKRVYS
jgi:hypothetical protein